MNILYIPGLGEGFVLKVQLFYIAFINAFRTSENRIVVFESRWESAETYPDKMLRLQAFYKKYNHPEVIVAPSAGGALATLLSNSNNDLKEVHVICAKLKGSHKIGEYYQKRAPALLDTVKASEKILKTITNKNIMSYVPNNEYDGVVDTEDMFEEGFTIIKLPNLRHSRAILYWLLRYLPKIRG